MSTTTELLRKDAELQRVTAELVALRERVSALADNWEGVAGAIAITYQDAEVRSRATGPIRQLVRNIRDLLTTDADS